MTTIENTGAGAAWEGVCSLCRTRPPSGSPSERLAPLIALNAPGWRGEPICSDCSRRFRFAHSYFGQLSHSVTAPPILPTPVRLGASPHYRGRGVTIAFLDAGFFAHPDLIEPDNRIAAYFDVTNPRATKKDIAQPSESSWHGLMTSVVACGDGGLSNGLYRGIASEARVVLVRVGSAHRVTHDDIRRGLDWITEHRAAHNIRVANVSVGGDFEASYLRDELSQSVERATRAGILVCVAAGNAGASAQHAVLPPASAPSALTVGGLDDHNRLRPAGFEMYRSSYGPTIDGLQKPEVIAPGIWVPAPILPGTPTAEQAALLETLSSAGDDAIHDVLAANAGIDKELDTVSLLPAWVIRRLIALKVHDSSVISGSYKHVDGTSFASPIVASIAAQLLEADPSLTPLEVKAVLTKTARTIPNVEHARQGFGVVDPRAALAAVLRNARSRGRSDGVVN